MRFRVIFLDPETQQLSRLTRTAAYMEAPFPDCLACRQGKAHTPRWMTALSFAICFISVICLFLSAMDNLPPSPLALFVIMVLASLVGWRFHQFITLQLETLAKRRKHTALDAPKEAPERMARVVCLLAEDAQRGLVGGQGTLTVILDNIDRLINMAQRHQYELRIRLEGEPCPALTDTLTAIARLRGHRVQLMDYRTVLQTFLQGCSEAAGELYAYHLMPESERPEIVLFEGIAIMDLSTLLFDGLGHVMRGVMRATRQTNPSQAIHECFERTVPDFLAAEKTVQAYLSALPSVPPPPPPLSSAQ